MVFKNELIPVDEIPNTLMGKSQSNFIKILLEDFMELEIPYARIRDPLAFSHSYNDLCTNLKSAAKYNHINVEVYSRQGDVYIKRRI